MKATDGQGPVYAYTCLHTFILLHTYSVHILLYNLHSWMYTCIYINVCIHIYKHTGIHKFYILINMNIYIRCIFVHVYIVYTCIHTYRHRSYIHLELFKWIPKRKAWTKNLRLLNMHNRWMDPFLIRLGRQTHAQLDLHNTHIFTDRHRWIDRWKWIYIYINKSTSVYVDRNNCYDRSMRSETWNNDRPTNRPTTVCYNSFSSLSAFSYTQGT